jgi:hypothetical protein
MYSSDKPADHLVRILAVPVLQAQGGGAAMKLDAILVEIYPRTAGSHDARYEQVGLFASTYLTNRAITDGEARTIENLLGAVLKAAQSITFDGALQRPHAFMLFHHCTTLRQPTKHALPDKEVRGKLTTRRSAANAPDAGQDVMTIDGAFVGCIGVLAG